MTDLSPATQAVKDAVLALYSDEKVHKFGWQLDAPTVVAALRALADQVVPDNYDPPRTAHYPEAQAFVDGKEYRNADVRYQILAIAAELEGGDE